MIEHGPNEHRNLVDATQLIERQNGVMEGDAQPLE